MKAVHEIVENSHTRNPMDIAMQIGIQIQYECMPMIFESFQIFAGSVLLLILNSDLDPSAYPYLVGCAIGHLRLHGPGDMSEEQKCEAETFASLLLQYGTMLNPA
jgi:hypothetical protein